MSKHRKRSQFGKNKKKFIYQNNPRPKDKGSSGDRKGVIQSVKGALDGRKSEASKTPAAPPSVAPTKSDFNVDKMLESQGITIPRSIMGDAATPAAKPTATPAAKPTATPASKPTATPAPTPTSTPPAKPAADSSGRGSIDGMPTAQALSEVKSRVDGILGAADKAPAKPPTPSPTPYTPPKDEDELKARQAAFEKLTNLGTPTISSFDYSSKDNPERREEAIKSAVQAGVSEERARAVAEANLSLGEIFKRQGAANKIDEALTKGEGLKEARQLAIERGVPEEKVDSYIASRDTPEFRKAQQLKQVREAGRRAAEAGKPKRRELTAEQYAQEAANLRAQGFTGVDGRGGLAELNQMQADRLSGIAPGTFSPLGSSKKIAPDSQIIDRYAKLVSEGRMTAEAARRAFGQDMLDKMRYDDPRLFARNEAEYQAAVAEAKRTGSPIPERPLPGADIDFAALARQLPTKQKPTFIGNFITGFGTKGVYDN